MNPKADPGLVDGKTAALKPVAKAAVAKNAADAPKAEEPAKKPSAAAEPASAVKAGTSVEKAGKEAVDPEEELRKRAIANLEKRAEEKVTKEKSAYE